MLSVTDFDPKGTISKVRVHVGLYLDIMDAGRSATNAVRVHAGTLQVDFVVDRPPPAVSPPGDLLITSKRNSNYLKKSFQKMKKRETCSYIRSFCKDACRNP